MNSLALVFGCDGQLASALIAATPAGFESLGRNRFQLDICDRTAVDAALREFQPSIAFNGAAYNAVDAAEGDGLEAAIRINALGVGVLASACRAANVRLVHFSTDLVFDGRKGTPYTEDDATRPLGVYGASKLAGENLALAANPANFAIRVCRLFGPTSSALQGTESKPFGNFPLLMLRLGSERGRVKVVNDQVGTPTYTPDLAKAVWQLVQSEPGGLFQLSNAGQVSYSEYAKEIFRLSGVRCDVEAVSSSDYGAAATRPLYTVMSNNKAHQHGVTPLRDWQAALAAYLGST